MIPSLENIGLWHERDISHSSVERVIGPVVYGNFRFLPLTSGSCLLMENLYCLSRKYGKNLYKLDGAIFSQNVLLKLTQKGMSREDSYKIVEKCA